MIKKYKNLLNEIHLNYINEIALLVVLNTLLLAATIITIIIFNSPLFVALFIALLLLSDFLVFNRYFVLKRKIYCSHLESLCHALTLVRLDLLSNIDKEEALKRLTESSDLEFNENANKIIEARKTDLSITPFLTFASFFKSNQATMLIASLYKMISGDVNRNLNAFNNAFDILETNIKQIRYQKLKKDYAFIRFSAFIGTALLLLIIVIAIILEIGNKFHG